jgi:hypothetical protein
LENGFYVDSGGNQRYTEGVYLSNHPEGGYGEITLQVCVEGSFLDFTDDIFADEWVEFKNKYWKGNYTKLTEDIRKDFPRLDGIAFNSMLVVWKPEKIKSIKECKIK